MENAADKFLQHAKDSLEITGIWDEIFKTTILKHMETMYKKEIVRKWGVSDMIVNGDKVLVKWYKRHEPLTDEALNRKYDGYSTLI